ncbi:MAG: ABC transporter ATP-binding protein [Clostridia bacterium]|nr:ABC transporter ATP-binding protein [Clostridia bacterium]
MEYHIKVENLDFGYYDDLILKDLNFWIKKGSFVTIIGPNGSGKSTLLKTLSKLILPDKGNILLENTNLLKLKPLELARHMAVVPQTFNIDFPFTVLETVLMGRSPFLKRFETESEQDLALAQWAMELTNTWHLRDRAVTELSGGELQRVIVARALTQEPKIILLDEPTAHLDIQHQMELLELLENLNQKNGLTVVTVLHDLNLASLFSEYVILMKEGKIFAMGETTEVLTPQNIREVYNMEVTLSHNPLTGKYNITPIARTSLTTNPVKDTHIHVICGGGTGSFFLEKLVQLGYQVSCGVLNIGDSDWGKAKKLNIEMVEEEPFAPISEANIMKNRTLMNKASYVIIAPVPFGPGNLPNLNLVLEACQQGKKVLFIENQEYQGKDFTGGQASALIKEIRQGGAKFFKEPKDLFAFLEQELTNEKGETNA